MGHPLHHGDGRFVLRFHPAGLHRAAELCRPRLGRNPDSGNNPGAALPARESRLAPLGRRCPHRRGRGADLAVIAILLVACGAVYNLLAIAGALAFRRPRSKRSAVPNYRPPLSVLKPVRGRDAGFYEAIRSHATQDYPAFELLFGVSDATDPAVAEIGRLQQEFPQLTIRIIRTSNNAPNGKVGSLV